MHESGSEPTRHTIPASQIENGNNTENESRLRSSQTPPPEAPRVSHSQLQLLNTSALVFKSTPFYKCGNICSAEYLHIPQKHDIMMTPYIRRAEMVCQVESSQFDLYSPTSQITFVSWGFKICTADNTIYS